MDFIRDDVGNDVKHDARDVIHDINIIIIMSQHGQKRKRFRKKMKIYKK
jgi:hypothetical protein